MSAFLSIVRWRTWLPLSLCTLLVLCLTLNARVSNAFSDPRFSLLVAQSIIQYHTVRLDPYKDAVLLNDLYERGEAPWRRW